MGHRYRIAFNALLLLGLPAWALAQEPTRLVRRQLPDTVTVDGIPCGPTGRAYAEFHPSERLASCPLAQPMTLAGHDLPSETWVLLEEDGTLRGAWLPGNTLLAGHLCRGTGYKGWSVRFYPSGALSMCYLAEVATIDGVTCQRGTFWIEIRGGTNSSVGFHENGRLSRCQAARDFTRDGVRIRKWDVVRLDPTGRLLTGG